MHKLHIEKQRLERKKVVQDERDRMLREFGGTPDEDEDQIEP